jgi:hypothetical protein
LPKYIECLFVFTEMIRTIQRILRIKHGGSVLG